LGGRLGRNRSSANQTGERCRQQQCIQFVLHGDLTSLRGVEAEGNPPVGDCEIAGWPIPLKLEPGKGPGACRKDYRESG
jgi:hypothetical protein